MDIEVKLDERGQARHQRAVQRPVIARHEPAFDFASSEYRSLFDRSKASPFQHPVWLDSFARHLVKPRRAAMAPITGRDPSTGELRFLLPMIMRMKAGFSLLESCDLGVSDYAVPVVDASYRPDDVGALRDAVRSALPRHDLMRVQPVRHEHVPLWKMFLNASSEALGFSAHGVTLPPKERDWRSELLSDGFAKSLARKCKKFAKEPTARLERVLPGEAASDAIRQLAQLRSGRFEGDLIQQSFVEEFYAEIAATGARDGLAQTFKAELEGEAIGYCFGLFHRRRFHYLLIGCDYERFGRYSPGLLLYEHMISDCVSNGGEVFDFTIGDEPFKQNFGTQPTPMFTLQNAASWRGKLALAALRAKRSLRADH